MKKTLKQIGYMLTSNRFRVAFVTLVADFVVLFQLELTPEKAETISMMLTAVGGILIAALSYRDPTSSTVEAIPGNVLAEGEPKSEGE